MTVHRQILDLLAQRGAVSSSDVADHLGVTRQAAHRQLRSLVEGGLILRKGAGRSAHYVRARRSYEFEFSTDGLAEDRVWRQVEQGVPSLHGISPKAASVLSYVVTELVNNAIDHSQSPTVRVAIESYGTDLELSIEDQGQGVFHNIQNYFGLASPYESIEELSKGKTTTWPERHTGEGIFFSSKAVDRFEMESGGLRWLIDNEMEDYTVEEIEPERVGTKVRARMNLNRPRDLTRLFNEYTEDFEFTRTRTLVRLYAINTRFVSRSEAKRLVRGLERFKEVVLDFRGVESVGQGFADEVFRVWHRENPKVALIPVRMNEAVGFMVERARRTAASGR